MNAQIELLQQQLDKQKKRLNKLMLLAALLLLILSSQFLFSFREYDGNKVLRARGIVIVDDEGRERILIGAPLPAARNRVRTDTARVRSLWAHKFGNASQYMKWYQDYDHQSNGILILDERVLIRYVWVMGFPMQISASVSANNPAWFFAMMKDLNGAVSVL
ncbi:MAG TPA: hypothetical protein PKJ94_08910 [Ferruginibacter sp.]|nr:hypothetical protein [Ferruginibacter sp.]